MIKGPSKFALFSFVSILLFSLSLPSRAQVIASDDASQSDYSNGWQSGDNGGSGFNPWSFSNNSGASTTFPDSSTAPISAGNFIGDSTQGSGDINTSAVSFGLFANPGRNGSGEGTVLPFADATRVFSAGALSINQTFSLDLAVNFRNGNKGIDLLDGGSTVFNLNIGANTYTETDDINTSAHLFGDTYDANTIFRLSFSQTSVGGGTWTVTRAGGLSGVVSGSYTGAPTGFKLYINNTDGGGSAANNLYANNLKVVPEPSSILLLTGGLLVITICYSRRLSPVTVESQAEI